MGYRLSKIYTRKGDRGNTTLGDGSRVHKDHLRVEVFGNVDELNSHLGVLLSHDLPAPVKQELILIQHRLFDLGGELCIPDSTVITAEHVTELEQSLDRMNADLEPLKEFILPGGSLNASQCHVARCVCRRAERSAVALAKTESVNEASIAYLNRLSDLLFVLARFLNKAAGADEVLWENKNSRRSE